MVNHQAKNQAGKSDTESLGRNNQQSDRSLRGFDPRRITQLLNEFTLRELRSNSSVTTIAPSIRKDDLVRRLGNAVASAQIGLRDILSSLRKSALQRVCRKFELDAYGTCEQLVQRLDRHARYRQLGRPSDASPSVMLRVDNSLAPKERLFILEVHSRLGHDTTRCLQLTLGEIIGRFGRHRAIERARVAAAREAGEILARNGIETSPNLLEAVVSPGIESLVELRVETSWANGTTNRSHEHADKTSAHEGAFALGIAVAQADGLIHHTETARLEMFLSSSSSDLSTEVLARLRRLLNNLRQAQLDENSALEKLTNESLATRRKALQLLFDVAVADGVLVTVEEQLLRQLGEILTPEEPLIERLICHWKRRYSAQIEPLTDPEATENDLSNGPEDTTTFSQIQFISQSGYTQSASIQNTSDLATSSTLTTPEVEPQEDYLLTHILDLLFPRSVAGTTSARGKAK